MAYLNVVHPEIDAWVRKHVLVRATLSPVEARATWSEFRRAFDVRGPVKGSVLDSPTGSSLRSGRGGRRRWLELLAADARGIVLLAGHGIGWRGELVVEPDILAAHEMLRGDLLVVHPDGAWAFVVNPHLGEALFVPPLA